jgi:hypothetical protein
MPLCIPQKCACISAPPPALLARIFTRRGFARRAPLPTRSTRTDTNCLLQCLHWFYIFVTFLWQKLAASEMPEFLTAKIQKNRNPKIWPTKNFVICSINKVTPFFKRFRYLPLYQIIRGAFFFKVFYTSIKFFLTEEPSLDVENLKMCIRNLMCCSGWGNMHAMNSEFRA